jgi:hypothetical protein
MKLRVGSIHRITNSGIRYIDKLSIAGFQASFDPSFTGLWEKGL